MSYLDTNTWLHGFNITIELLQRLSVLSVAAYVAMRWTWLREALHGASKYWRHRLIAAVFFGVLAIIGSHSGVILDLEHGNVVNWRPAPATGLQKSQAIVAFRDLTVMVAGLTCGIWGGLGAGLLAGFDRYFMGGFVGLGAALATVLVGLGSGWAMQCWPGWSKSLKGTVTIILTGTLLQKVVILVFSQNFDDTLTLVETTFVASILSNLLGALLFLAIMQELERERLLATAELRALQAQVDPHFLNGTLTSIRYFTNNNPTLAAQSVSKLAEFFRTTRDYAAANSITLNQELEHLKHYVDLRKLWLPQGINLDFRVDIPPGMGAFCIPPRSIETLVENIFTHGLRGQSGILEIRVIVRAINDKMTISIMDNGCGIAPERLADLGKRIVDSPKGTGNALYQLQQCLALAFNGLAKMLIESQPGKGTHIVLTIPKRSRPW